MARFMVFLTDDDYPARDGAPAPMEPPADLVAALTGIARGVPGHSHGGNLAELMECSAPMHAYTVPLTPEAEMAMVQTMAAAIYERLNCAGVVRIDYIINETGLIYVLEINTVPGQSENSIIPQQVRATGMDMTTFYGLLVTEALK
jgi:hypothetical protein